MAGAHALVAAGGLVRRFHHYGPALAAFVTNFLATFGDKGQLAVVTLATVYDARRVFLGAVTAFGVWNAVEVTFGSAVVDAAPPGVLEYVTGGLFLLFGAWAGFQAYDVLTGEDADRDGERLLHQLVPGDLYGRVQGSGAFAVAFVTIAVAEFGDKTQLLTINLAATFPDAPLAVFAGAWLGLALRTGLDAFVGETVEQYLPVGYVQGAATLIFVSVGLFEWDVLTGPEVVVVAAVAVAVAVAGGVYRQVRTPRGT
ncbi:MAG: TMEM165/GDT1 family protein [Haloferacaceae archaeon]